MPRREFLKLAGTAPAAALPGAGADKRPNFVFILADDMGYMDSPLYGSRYYDTPHLERLAKRGMLFTDAYSASPLCSPTRASILTGKYPARTGITTPAGHLPDHPPGMPLLAAKAPPHQKMVTPESRRVMKLEEYTLAEAFRDAGYRTGLIGKWHLGLDEKYWAGKQGFEVDLGAPVPGPPSFFAPYRMKNFPDGPKGEYATDRVGAEAVRFIERRDGRPFLLCMWQFGVHAPFQAKAEITGRYRAKKDPRGKQASAVMASMLFSLDESVGRVLDKLDSLAIADRTVVIFVSDNGGNMYNEVEGTTPTNNSPLRGTKGNVYEGGTRVPCVVAWPGVTKPGSRSPQVISTVDFYPTLLEMASIPRPGKQKLDGVSVVPALRGGAIGREAVFCHFPHYAPATQNRPATWVRKGDWKLIRFYGEGADRSDAYELYNLRRDLGERNDLSAAMPAKTRELARLIDRHIADTDALIPIENPAYRPPEKNWQASPGSRLTVRDGALRLELAGAGAYMRTADFPVIAGFMAVRFRMRSSLGGAGEVAWSAPGGRRSAAPEKTSFPVKHDGEWHDYEVPLEAAGRLAELRIRPAEAAGTVEFRDLRLQRKYGELLKAWRFE